VGVPGGAIKYGLLVFDQVAAAGSMREILKLRGLKSDLGFPDHGPTVIQEDNQTVVRAVLNPQWLCATADHWTAVRHGGPLVRGSWAAASGGPFWAARTSCGNVRTVLERYQAPLSSSKRVWLNSDIWPLSTCLNLPLSAARNLTLPRACT
jgi:hypothetical protein